MAVDLDAKPDEKKPHPFFDAPSFPWQRKDAQAFFKALYKGIKRSSSIELLYEQAGGVDPLTTANPKTMWQEALDALTVAGKLEQLCDLILEDKGLLAIHNTVDAVKRAKGPLDEVVLPPAPTGPTLVTWLSKLAKSTKGKLVMLAAAIAFIAINVGYIEKIADAWTKFTARHSQTSFRFIDADAESVWLEVRNAGRRPSTLQEYRMKFGKVPVGAVDSTAHEAKLSRTNQRSDRQANIDLARTILAGSPVTIRLTVDELAGMPKPGRPERYTADEIADLLRNQLAEEPVTIEIDVKESNDSSEHPFHTRSEEVPARVLALFIDGRMR